MSYIDWWETPGQTEPTRTTLTLRGALIYPKTTVHVSTADKVQRSLVSFTPSQSIHHEPAMHQ
jgi:hypothetical protein